MQMEILFQMSFSWCDILFIYFDDYKVSVNFMYFVISNWSFQLLFESFEECKTKERKIYFFIDEKMKMNLKKNCTNCLWIKSF